MNRRRGGSSRKITGSIALAVVVALALAGCSGEDKPTPNAVSGSTSPSSSPGVTPSALHDESAAVLGWSPPTPVAKTEGKVPVGITAHMTPTAPATAEIISVRASETSTILTWQLSSATDIPIQVGLNTISPLLPWPDRVRLVDPAGKKSYAVNTTLGGDGYWHCVCSRYATHMGPDPVRMTAAYPPLSATVTSISVRVPSFAPVTVPVTR